MPVFTQLVECQDNVESTKHCKLAIVEAWSCLVHELRGISWNFGLRRVAPSRYKKNGFQVLRIHAHQPFFGLGISGFYVQTLISAFSQILTNSVDLMSSRVRAQVLMRTLWHFKHLRAHPHQQHFRQMFWSPSQPLDHQVVLLRSNLDFAADCASNLDMKLPERT